MFGITFDMSSESDAENAVKQTDYLLIFIEATESGRALAHRLSQAAANETRQPSFIVGICPHGESSLVRTFEKSGVLPPGFADMISTPIRTDVLYECICCAGSSLTNELDRESVKDTKQAESRSETLQCRDRHPKELSPVRDTQLPPLAAISPKISQRGPVTSSVTSFVARRVTTRSSSVVFRGPMPSSMTMQHRIMARGQPTPKQTPLPRSARVATADV